MITNIINYLKTQSAVTDIVGDDPIKMFAGEVPKVMDKASGNEVAVTAPYILIEERGGEKVRCMEGRTGVRDVDFLIEAVSYSKLEVIALYEALGDALDVAAHETWGTIEVQYSEMDEPTAASIPPSAGEEYELKVLGGHLFVRAVY
jgi:hypothetical protein